MLKDIAETTGEAPDALLRRPRLRPDVWGYWDGFFTLSDARQHNQTGLLPIQVSEVLAYCDVVGIPRGDPAAKMLRIVQAMDKAYLAYQHKKMNKKV